LLVPERYFLVDGNQSIEDIHTNVSERVSQIQALKRNAREDKGSLLLRPIRAVNKVVRSTATKTSSSASKAVRNVSKKSPVKKKPVKKK